MRARGYAPGDDGIVPPESVGEASGLSTNLTPPRAFAERLKTEIWRIPYSKVPPIFNPGPDPNNSDPITWDVRNRLRVMLSNLRFKVLSRYGRSSLKTWEMYNGSAAREVRRYGGCSR